jgi:hypothetical protein
MWNHYPSWNETLRNNHEEPTHGHLVYPKDLLLSWIKMGLPIQTYQGSERKYLPSSRHVPFKNLPYTHHLDHLKMHNL